MVGKFYRTGKPGSSYLVIEKVYKGTFAKDTVQLSEGGTDCTEVFMEQADKTLILGLFKSACKSSPNAYTASSCVTSVLAVNGDKITSKTDYNNLHIANPRIGLRSTQMRKDKFEKQVKRRL